MLCNGQGVKGAKGVKSSEQLIMNSRRARDASELRSCCATIFYGYGMAGIKKGKKMAR
jgi:hypothetical protein